MKADQKKADQKIQVFILTYERPQLFAEALRSVLRQNYSNFEVIVSDNSLTDKTAQVVAGFDDPRIIYRRRKPSLPPLQHFNQVLSEVTADYFMMFHDDDLMLPDCLQTLMAGFGRGKKLAAVGGNASIIFNQFFSQQKYICSETDSLFVQPARLVRRYLISGQYAPFPAYLYCRPVIEGLTMSTSLGKHADVIFLADSCKRAPVLMLSRVVMNYRIHPAQDTAKCSLRDRRLMVQWACRELFLRNSPEIQFFRITGLLEKTRSSGKTHAKLRFGLFFRLIILHLKYFRLQFFFLFIRLSQRLLQKMCMNRITKKG